MCCFQQTRQAAAFEIVLNIFSVIEKQLNFDLTLIGMIITLGGFQLYYNRFVNLSS